jgi:hypothetical protein
VRDRWIWRLGQVDPDGCPLAPIGSGMLGWWRWPDAPTHVAPHLRGHIKKLKGSGNGDSG